MLNDERKKSLKKRAISRNLSLLARKRQTDFLKVQFGRSKGNDGVVVFYTQEKFLRRRRENENRNVLLIVFFGGFTRLHLGVMIIVRRYGNAPLTDVLDHRNFIACHSNDHLIYACYHRFLSLCSAVVF